jgi:hypothetical protein
LFIAKERENIDKILNRKKKMVVTTKFGFGFASLHSTLLSVPHFEVDAVRLNKPSPTVSIRSIMIRLSSGISGIVSI